MGQQNWTMGKLTLVLGGARSGKSAYAERIAAQSGAAVLYVATAQPLDDEMRTRVAAHKLQRSVTWQTLEVATDVGRYLLAHPPHQSVIVLDCLTLLVSNLVLQAARDIDQPDESAARVMVEGEIKELLKAIEDVPAHWLVVSNEVGHGLVPPYPVGRIFRDLLGWANQRLASRADEVIWMVAGIPVPIGDYRKD
jgi:adenosylcobinamide kinase/adenosylcobinamide-phosphate guanylyltransferase